MTVLETYLADWAQVEQTGRSLALYETTADQVRAGLAQAAAAAISAECVTLSEFAAGTPLPAAELVVVWQDLAWEAFAPRTADLVDQILFPLWFEARPFAFFSRLPQAAYARKTMTPADVHGALDDVHHYLLREQMLAILATGNGSQPRPRPRVSFPVDDNLDANQRQAQRHIRGPIRVLAPAGSGKTKTLTNRIVHLLNEGVPADAILALAFNRKAAAEMTGRLRQKGIDGLNIRTFHSLGYSILRRQLGWHYRAEQHERQLRALLGQALAGNDIQLPARRDSDMLAPFLEMLSRVKNELLPLDEALVEVEETPYPFAAIFDTMLRLQYQQQFLSFDDMIYLAARVLLRDDDLRRQYQARFHYVLVDEFQDLNRAQLLLLDILALPQNNLFVVGDDDQMIYGWRGAEVDHILDFPQRFPLAAQSILSINYRSAAAIVDHSRRLIDYNKTRVAKNIRPRPGAPAGAVAVELYPDLWQQARRAADWAAELAADDPSLARTAILFRYRAYQFPLALALDQRGLPHTPVDLRQLFQTAVGRDIAAYLHVILDPESAPAEAFQRVLKRPNKYLTNQLINSVTDWAAFNRVGAGLDMPEWAWERVVDFVQSIRDLQRAAAQEPLKTTDLLFQLDLFFELEDYYRDQTRTTAAVDEETDVVLLQTIYALAAHFERPADFFDYLQIPPQPAGAPAAETGLVLSTIHRAKGKEYEHVLYYNLSRDAHATDVENLEEERRVAYVAATRAQSSLLITAIKGKASPFLRELWLNPRYRHFSRQRLEQEGQRAERRLKRVRKDLQKLNGKEAGQARRATLTDEAAQLTQEIERLAAEQAARQLLGE